MGTDTLLFECVGIKDKGKFPIENTGRGRDISPEFRIQNLSPAAKTLAVTLEDIGHPLFKNFTHWLIWNIPATATIAGAIPGGKYFIGIFHKISAWKLKVRELHDNFAE